MDWTILGINPTKDKKEITTAYRAKLMQVNPEDKPEEFKALRAAYEEALAYAQQADAVPERDESPVGLWMEKVRAVYDNFAARIDPDSWRELLEDDVCIALDQRGKAEEALLRFFLDDYFIPQSVWIVLNETFDFISRQEELYEMFPRDFIDFAVMNGIRLAPGLPYELFTPGISGKDCDAYRRLYHRANQMPPAEMGPVLDEMEALSEQHPYGQLLRHRLELELGEEEKAAAGYRMLAMAYPDDSVIVMGWASICARKGDWAAVEQLTRQVLAVTPDHWNAKRTLADALAYQGRYDEAKELMYDLMRAAGGDQLQIHLLGQTLRQWNEDLIRIREQTLAEHPEDTKNALELGWCYLQNDRHEDALRVAAVADPDYEDQYAYHNFLGKLHYGMESFETALNHFVQLEQVIHELQPDGTEKTEKRIRVLPEIIQLQGSCLLAMKRHDEAVEKYEQALAMAPNNAEILTHTARMYAFGKQYDKAIPLLQRVNALLPTGYHGYYLLAQVLFEINRDREAFDAVNRALELEGGDLWVYILKMRILIRNELWDATGEILEFLEQHKLGEVPAVMFCKAELMEFAEKNSDESLKLYQAVAQRLEAGDEMENSMSAKNYYRIASILIDRLDMSKQEDRDELMAVVEKGLKYDSDDPNCLEYKAWLLKRNGEIEQSKELYHRLEALPHHPLVVERNLAELYYKNLKKHADTALKYYLLLIERQESADLHFYAGTCHRFLYDFEAAEQNFLREQELAPDDMDGYNGLAYVYEAMNRLPEALVQVNKAITIAKERKGNYGWLFGHKVQILRRMNRAQEAIDTVYDAMSRYDYPEGHELKFDICCQFGLWDKAAKMLEEWKAAEGNISATACAGVRLQLMTGHPVKARLEMAKVGKLLDEDDSDALRLQIAELKGDFKTAVQVWTKRRADTKDLSHVLMNLSEALLFSGDLELSRKTAEEALKELEQELQEHRANKTLCRTRKAMTLALLGRREEAHAELAQARKMPLCAGCSYCSCKDADIFEATMEEVFGNYRKAEELYRKYLAQWPDELDFVTGLNRVKRKDK